MSVSALPAAIQGVPRLAWSIKEAESVLGMGRSSLYKLIATGELRTVKLGGRRLIPHDALLALLDGDTDGAS